MTVTQRERDELYADLAAANLAPLWTQRDDLMPMAPQSDAVPMLWRWSALYPLAARSGELVPVGRGGERRAIALANPGLPGTPYATPTLWAAIQYLGPREMAPSHHHTQTAFRFVIEGEGKGMGSCALFHPDTTGQTCELGIGIGDRDYWARGCGRESIRLLLEYAFRYLNYRKVWLRVHATNERAIRAYRACGFVEEGRQRAQVWSNGAYDDLVLMGILREEWPGAGSKPGKGS